MSRKLPHRVAPLDRLAFVEAPAYLDQLVLERARSLMARHSSSTKAEPRPRGHEREVAAFAALFARLAR